MLASREIRLAIGGGLVVPLGPDEGFAINRRV